MTTLLTIIKHNIYVCCNVTKDSHDMSPLAKTVITKLTEQKNIRILKDVNNEAMICEIPDIPKTKEGLDE